jgi:hypothetical protein
MQSLEKAFKIEHDNNLTRKELELFLKKISVAKTSIDPFYQTDLTKNLFLDNKGNFIGKI